tara:strand:+ start:565 stop:1257 length:693 start_codon:yes stop_codon:yes gene_type:complete
LIHSLNISVIIPARGGSKGIPGKNIKNFEGKPLITHTIDYALSSKHLINNIIVSTDDDQIAAISKASGVEIIERPKHLATDTASTESVIEHAIPLIKPNPDILILLQPTSPLRPKGSLEIAINKFIDGNYDSFLSLSPTHNFFWSINKNYAKAKYDFNNRPRRQDIVESKMNYVENGSIYIFTTKNFNSTKNRLGGNIGYIIFDEEFSHEVDTPQDLKILEQISRDLIKN